MQKLLNLIKNHQPADELEKADIETFKHAISILGEKILHRDSLIAHLSSSIWVVNPQRTKVLMAYHNIYKSFAWFGGHNDGEKDPLEVAKKEMVEECGITNFKILNNEKPASFDICQVGRHTKKGKQLSSRLHYNTTYIFEVDESETFRIAEGENSAIRWINNEDVERASSEDHIKPIYCRLQSLSQKL